MRQGPSQGPVRLPSKRKPPGIGVLCAFLGLLAPVYSSLHPRPPQEPIPPAAVSTDTTPRPVVLDDGTGVSLRLAEFLNAAEAKPGDAVRLVATGDIRAGGLIVVAKGAPGGGRVVDVRPPRRLGRSAEISIDLEWVESVTGDKVPLRAVHRAKGLPPLAVHERRLEKLYGIPPPDKPPAPEPLNPLGGVEDVTRTIVVTPAVPFVILFGKGTGVILQPGTRVLASVEGNVSLDAAKVQAEQIRFPRAGGDARVTFLRPKDDVIYRPWLHCQGVKLAHLGQRRYFQMRLRPGKYTCHAKHVKPVEFEFLAGEEYFVSFRHRFSLTSLWELILLDSAEAEDEVALAEPVKEKDTKAFGELVPSP